MKSKCSPSTASPSSSSFNFHENDNEVHDCLSAGCWLLPTKLNATDTVKTPDTTEEPVPYRARAPQKATSSSTTTPENSHGPPPPPTTTSAPLTLPVLSAKSSALFHSMFKCPMPLSLVAIHFSPTLLLRRPDCARPCCWVLLDQPHSRPISNRLARRQKF
ncbi:uncharacterized protein LOC124193864 [Daphnia pulex]|uniref:uncharacterized protein LOC124193864 n=1 Tax=Daphnia pulex TaxID=6669 RepID=UPI001EDE6086|nr:uncharacterized protein LOC124193864 [Daphnia pulex]